jgi:4-carboxymuconolactone decarboxylase
MCTISALMALGQLPLLRRHIERSLNLGMTPQQVVEIFIHLTFYVGVPAVEAAMRTTKDIFEEQGVQFTPDHLYDSNQTPEELHLAGLQSYEEHYSGPSTFASEDPDSVEAEVERFIEDYHWGAIYGRPTLDAKSRAICALSAMTVSGQYDRQLRRRIEGALRVGLTPEEIMEVFVQLILYGGYIHSRTAMRVARSVFTEQGVES